MPMRNQLQRETGATFIEAIIAAGILAIVLCSVLAVVSQSFRYMADIRLTARSSQILQQKMEDIRLLTWTSIQALPSSFTDPSDTNGAFTGTINVSDYDSYSGTTTVKRITLTVSWMNRVSKLSSNSLSTLIANGGLNKYIF